MYYCSHFMLTANCFSNALVQFWGISMQCQSVKHAGRTPELVIELSWKRRPSRCETADLACASKIHVERPSSRRRSRLIQFEEKELHALMEIHIYNANERKKISLSGFSIEGCGRPASHCWRVGPEAEATLRCDSGGADTLINNACLPFFHTARLSLVSRISPFLLDLSNT